MTIDEIRDIRSSAQPTEREYFDAHSLEIVDTLLTEVDRLNTQLSGRTYFHSDVAVEEKLRVATEALENITRLNAWKDKGHFCHSKQELNAAHDIAAAALKEIKEDKVSNGFEMCDQHTYLFATEGKDCPYCKIDTLLAEADKQMAIVAKLRAENIFVNDMHEFAHARANKLEAQLRTATEALDRIVADGDFSAPEGMKRTATTALKEIGVSDET